MGENYQDAVNEPEAVTWQEFLEKFHEYHIPKGIMEIKVQEFCSLRQGPLIVNQYIRRFMKLARYAPEDVNSDKKKQKCFRRGLNESLREQMITHIYPDFNTLMNHTILLEEERVRGEGERKHKFLIQRARQQESQRVRTNNTAPTRYQPTMQYRTSRPNTL